MKRYSTAFLLIFLACHSDNTVAPNSGTGPADVNGMSVGEVRVLTPSQVPNGLEFPAGTGVTDYLVVVGNSNPTPDVTATYVAKANLLSGSPQINQAVVSPFDGGGVIAENAQDAAESRIRHFERARFKNLRSSVASNAGLRPRNDLRFAAVPAEGTTVTLHVPNEQSADICTNFFTVTAVVKKVSNRAIILLDTQAPQFPNSFSDADYTAIAAEFDLKVFPTDSSYFDVPTDIDANSHVMLLYTTRVNDLTNPGEASFVGGFFFAGDLFPPTGTNSCAESNQAEIFYLLAPDPLATHGNVRTTATVRQGTRGTVAHEFQHMINAGNRIKSGASAFESVWLDEGLAHAAEDAVGRVVDGFSDFQTLSDADIFQSGNPTLINNYNAFFFQNLNRYKTWLLRPDTSSGISSRADKNLSSRGAIWALLRWTGDNLSGGDFRDFTRKLAAGPDTGIKNLVAKANVPLDTILAGWLVTNYSDHTGIANLATKYNYKGYNMRSVEPPVNQGNYPLQLNVVTTGTNLTTTTMSGSGVYFRVNLPAGTARTVKFVDPGGANLSFTGAHYYVLRID